jgi:hypothetical protein
MGAVNSAGTDWPLLAVAVEIDRRSLKRIGVPAGTTMVRAMAEPADATVNRRAKETAAYVFVVMAPSAAIPVRISDLASEFQNPASLPLFEFSLNSLKGSVLPVLPDLADALRWGRLATVPIRGTMSRKKILLVDDSMTILMMERAV